MHPAVRVASEVASSQYRKRESSSAHLLEASLQARWDSFLIVLVRAFWSTRMKQKTEPLNEAEVAWIKIQLENASQFIEAFSPSHAHKAMTLSALDGAFAAWIASEPTETGLVNAVINYVGIAFGQALVDGVGLNWVVATDEQNSELAVYGFPGQGDILIYPANFVAKRWERREINFLEKAYNQIGYDVRTLFRHWQRP
jgi:hypothetical protein